jgi:DNA-binding NarL/FixJ family response regulator
LLVDDHALVRAGLRSLLQGITGVQVVGEASNGREGLHMMKSEHPDIVIMDISMEELNGLEALERASKELPNIRIIILTMHDDREHVLQALRAGAAGYLLKDSLATELELAIRSVAHDRHKKYLSPSISHHLVDQYMQHEGAEERDADELTPRQREILQLIAEGHSTKEIAAKLGVSPKTVEAHRAQMFGRLKIHSVAELTKYAIRKGITPHTVRDKETSR